jgi:hypothetical protein
VEIRKEILYDENHRPIAVRIDYGDWRKIEQVLARSEQAPPKQSDLSQFFGTLEWPEDPLEYQNRLRDEWR